MGKVISFANQKGGVGKSTVTSFVANYIHQEYKDLKIVVVDADDLQTSLYKIRQEELMTAEPQINEEDCYNLVKMSSKLFSDNVEILIDEYDLVFLDIPGNLKQAGVIESLMMVDVMIVPIEGTKIAMDSSIDFINFYIENVMKIRLNSNFSTKCSAVLNRVKVNSLEFKEIKNNRESFPIKIMENYFPESVIFQRGISTINKYESDKKSFEPLIKELLEFILN